MDKNLKNYLQLFRSTFFLSAFTFGGGYVIIPLMKKRFVDELGWLTEEEMLNMAAIAQSSPGAMAVNASILVGWRLMGFSGALIAILGTVLPPFIILSVLSLFYTAFRDNQVVSAVLKGMMAGVSAVIFDVVITMSGKIIKTKKWLPIVIMTGAFCVYYFFHINIIYIILFCGALGILVSMCDKHTGKEHI
ncbi:chromate transporter [Clostridium sp. C105KSO13]|uniref:chromate transporter n=1 Tax=Clostridium sp. C105KSO13 TaxID=1776045 RepID=UPI0007408869|nr:chromate transporter [Clostridium sp. C105KSO13]CUX35609.1 putative chromate transport protein [Clostridium sp. C105KSO13]